MSVAGKRQRITVAILALGGQGGGVLADWIVAVAERGGYTAQATSVPGVAQRTGSTVYYVEMLPPSERTDMEPVLALMPMPGDVDIVLAAELMEAGRAILRGFATEQTTLISSTHRIYAISEKSALGDGRASSERILEAAQTRCARFIGFDMEAVAGATGSVISSVLLGALAGSGALPFPREAFEAAILSGGKGVEQSITAFARGFECVHALPPAIEETKPRAAPASRAGRQIADRIERELPEAARATAREGVRRLMDYQDARYAGLYLDRLAGLRASKADPDGKVVGLAAKHLALWMSYEDTIRVADLKVRASRLDRVRKEVKAPDDALISVTEYMHPRTQEICETLPRRLGAALLASRRTSRLLDRFLSKGKHVRTTSLRWFLVLATLASLRRFRRATLRYDIEQKRIDNWLALVREALDELRIDAAVELVECQRLIKGYGETHERGLSNFNRVVGQWPRLRTRADASTLIAQFRKAALSDEEGQALSQALAATELDRREGGETANPELESAAATI